MNAFEFLPPEYNETPARKPAITGITQADYGRNGAHTFGTCCGKHRCLTHHTCDTRHTSNQVYQR